jgi:hypothetical protein
MKRTKTDGRTGKNVTKRPRTKEKKTPSTVVPPSPRTFVAGLDPVRLVEIVDEYYGRPDQSVPYKTQYQELRAYFLDDFGENCATLANLFSQLDDFAIIEEAFRRAGFVLGFNVCRQLLLGELDIEALKKDEQGDESDEGGAQ